MNKGLKLVAVLAGILVVMGVSGAVNIASVTTEPSDTLWQSQEFQLETVCEPTSENFHVYVNNITRGGNQSYPEPDELEFTRLQDENTYVLEGSTVKDFLNARYGYTPGAYSLFVTCAGENASDVEQTTFTAKTLTADVSPALGETTFYAAQQKRLAVTLKERGEGSPTYVGGGGDDKPQFTVTVNGESVPVSPYFNADTRKWVLNPQMPEESGTYTLKITAHHDGATTTVAREIVVRDALQFDAQLSKTRLSSGQDIELTVNAVHRSEPLDVAAGDLLVTMDGQHLAVTPVENRENTFTVTMPDKAPAAYELAVNLETADVTAQDTFTISYPIPIQGAFTQPGGNDAQYTLKFVQNGNTVEQEDGRGRYKTRLVPGNYNVTTEIEGSTLTLRNVPIDVWDDPLRFYRYNNADISGLATAGVYSFATSLSFDMTELTLRYNPGAVNNPEQLQVYQCADWNSAKAACYGEWAEADATFHETANTVTVATSAEGAIAVGKRDGLRIRYSKDDVSGTYTPGNELAVTGLVRGPDGKVENASVTMTVEGTDISQRTWTDQHGSFDGTFTVPDAAAQYRLTLEAEKSLYQSASAHNDFTVERPAAIDLVAPKELRLQANTSHNTTVYVKNTGYRTIDRMKPVTSDLPFLQATAFDARPLQMNESRALTLTFAVPANASADTHTAELGLSYSGKTASHVFGITVDPVERRDAENETNTAAQATSGMLTGNVPSLPALPDTPTVSQLAGGSMLETVVLVLISLQVLVVLVYSLHGRLPRLGRIGNRDRNIGQESRGGRDGGIVDTMAGIKAEIGETTGSAGNYAGTNAVKRKKDGVEREQVLRAMNHVKEQITATHQGAGSSSE